jgi:hypothetical protein
LAPTASGQWWRTGARGALQCKQKRTQREQQLKPVPREARHLDSLAGPDCRAIAIRSTTVKATSREAEPQLRWQRVGRMR